MKKTIFTVLGLATACAACCAMPLLLSSAVGLSAAGLAIVEWGPTGLNGIALLAGIATLAVGGVGWSIRRRRQTACGATSCNIEAGPTGALQAPGQRFRTNDCAKRCHGKDARTV